MSLAQTRRLAVTRWIKVAAKVQFLSASGLPSPIIHVHMNVRCVLLTDTGHRVMRCETFTWITGLADVNGFPVTLCRHSGKDIVARVRPQCSIDTVDFVCIQTSRPAPPLASVWLHHDLHRYVAVDSTCWLGSISAVLQKEENRQRSTNQATGQRGAYPHCMRSCFQFFSGISLWNPVA